MSDIFTGPKCVVCPRKLSAVVADNPLTNTLRDVQTNVGAYKAALTSKKSKKKGGKLVRRMVLAIPPFNLLKWPWIAKDTVGWFSSVRKDAAAKARGRR